MFLDRKTKAFNIILDIKAFYFYYFIYCLFYILFNYLFRKNNTSPHTYYKFIFILMKFHLNDIKNN